MAHEYMVAYAAAAQGGAGTDFLVSQLRGALSLARRDVSRPTAAPGKVNAA